jgi:hypothetical protein
VIEAWTAAAIVTGIGVCIINELNATPESGGVPANMRIVPMTPGNIAWDACECGQFAQSIQRDYPSSTFPTDTASLPRKGSGCKLDPIAFQVIASILRCVPGMTNTSTPRPPTPASLLTAALIMEGDAFALRSAVECCLDQLKKDRRLFDFRISGVTRVGPEGGCAGVEMQYWFQLM